MMRVQKNEGDIGRCGCGRREYCDGSHGLTEAQWQERLAQEKAAAQQNTPTPSPAPQSAK